MFETINKGRIKGFFADNGNCRYWYPKNRLYYQDGTPFLKKERFESIDELFTKRNLVALARLYDRIKEIEDPEVKDGFKYCFSSLTHLASKMTPVRPTRPFSSAWVQQSYWYCENNMESNVWKLFDSAVNGRQGLIKAKEDLPKNMRVKKAATSLSQLQSGRRHYYVESSSAIDFLDELEENSIDYVITDPPYGYSIQYVELLFMWGCWLGLMDDFDEIVRGEIIENQRQRKSEKDYENMLYVAFRKVFNLLKPGRYCTITFHNPKLKYRNILFRSVMMSGFEFEKIIYQPAPRPSAKSLLQPFGSLEGDYFFRFRKPEVRKEDFHKSVDEKRVETLIVNIAKRIIADRGEPTHYTFIQNSIDPILYEELKKYGLVMDFQPKSVKDVLNKYVGKVFQLVEMEVGRTKQRSIMGKGWWFIDPNEHRLDIPLNKRIDEAIENLLRKKRKVTFTEVLTEVYTRFQNALTPEEYTIIDILKENANPVAGGKWEIKRFVEDVAAKHEEMVFYLAKIGEKSGYKISIAADEYHKYYRQKTLGSLLNLSKVRVKGISERQFERIKNIDVLWHTDEEIIAEFEVEHSTSIVDAVVRGSNLNHRLNITRIIVIPEGREDLVYRRFNEPAMQTIMKDMVWNIVTYEDLTRFYLGKKRKLSIDPKMFFSLSRAPLSKDEKERRKQSNLSEWA